VIAVGIFKDGLDTPYAVYGTLRSGQGNHVLWAGLAESRGTSEVEGYRLVTNGGFPYALPCEAQSIVVEIIRPFEDEDAREELRIRLDTLEGYPTLYGRAIVMVRSGGSSRPCWLYVPRNTERLERLPAVPENDWNMRGPLSDAEDWA
jgi:gamma-glutamylcyclotransferase (GGCT)/AIG2-like uncharacterized protein YtfP